MSNNPFQAPKATDFNRPAITFPWAYGLTSLGVLLAWGILLLVLWRYANLKIVDGQLQMTWTWTSYRPYADPVIATHLIYTSLSDGIILFGLFVLGSLAVANAVLFAIRRRRLGRQ